MFVSVLTLLLIVTLAMTDPVGTVFFLDVTIVGILKDSQRSLFNSLVDIVVRPGECYSPVGRFHYQDYRQC
jgi:hypothetical protein